MDIQRLVGQLPVDQVTELLEELWAAATTEDKETFTKAHRNELEELVEGLPE